MTRHEHTGALLERILEHLATYGDDYDCHVTHDPHSGRAIAIISTPDAHLEIRERSHGVTWDAWGYGYPLD